MRRVAALRNLSTTVPPTTSMRFAGGLIETAVGSALGVGSPFGTAPGVSRTHRRALGCAARASRLRVALGLHGDPSWVRTDDLCHTIRCLHEIRDRLRVTREPIAHRSGCRGVACLSPLQAPAATAYPTSRIPVLKFVSPKIAHMFGSWRS